MVTVGRIVGIDYGKARIGVAMTDPMRIICSPHATVPSAPSMKGKAAEVVKSLPDLSEIDLFVVGLPLHMKGNESPMSEEARKFAAALETETGKEVVLFDERLTSKGAESILRSGGLNRKERAKNSDKLSACLLLETYTNTL